MAPPARPSLASPCSSLADPGVAATGASPGTVSSTLRARRGLRRGRIAGRLAQPRDEVLDLPTPAARLGQLER